MGRKGISKLMGVRAILAYIHEKGPYKLLIAKQVAPFHTIWTALYQAKEELHL